MCLSHFRASHCCHSCRSCKFILSYFLLFEKCFQNSETKKPTHITFLNSQNKSRNNRERELDRALNRHRATHSRKRYSHLMEGMAAISVHLIEYMTFCILNPMRHYFRFAGDKHNIPLIRKGDACRFLLCSAQFSSAYSYNI